MNPLDRSPSPSPRALRQLSLLNLPSPKRISPIKRFSPKKSLPQKSPLRKSNRLQVLRNSVVEEEGFCSSCDKSFTVVAVACLEHRDCKFIGKHEMKSMLERVFACSREFIHLIDNPTFSQWVDGQIIIREMTKSDLWDNHECRYCFINDFLSDVGRHAWMLCLRFMGEDEAYMRSMQCLKAQDKDVDAISRWVESTLTRCKGNSQKELAAF